MDEIVLASTKVVPSWKFSKNGNFSVKSVYKALTIDDAYFYYQKIWKRLIPAKIKNFLWLLANNAILTRDNMVRRKWTGDPSCLLCDEDEAVTHLFFQCSMAKAVWAIVAHCLGASNVPRNFN